LESFYAHGKLLLTGEYVVLTGAMALAVPTRLGQFLNIDKPEKKNQINWTSLDQNNNSWFMCSLAGDSLEIIESTASQYSRKLQSILRYLREENDVFLTMGASITTKLEFDRFFGLGTSSSLISLLAQASDVDPYSLNRKAFGGSGYDIACATSNHPIFFKISSEAPSIEKAKINKSLIDHGHFVYLERKQNSKEEVLKFDVNNVSTEIISAINEITQQLSEPSSYIEMLELITRHEKIISHLIGQSMVQQKLFKDFWGGIKSLGAWGGDFILAVSNREEIETKRYFADKGFATSYSFRELILIE